MRDRVLLDAMNLGRRCWERDLEAATGFKAILGSEADVPSSHARVLRAHNSHADEFYAITLCPDTAREPIYRPFWSLNGM